MKQPCYQCKFRNINCHATCPEYKEYQKENEKLKKKIKKLKQQEYYQW